jgi:hypothetical protein
VHIKSQKDFFSGLMFLLVGIAFAWGAGGYSVGTGARMGPGYFPMVLGVLLAGIGFWFEGKKALILLGLGTCALVVPWLFTIMFPRDLVFSYRARQRSLDAENALPPHR